MTSSQHAQQAIALAGTLAESGAQRIELHHGDGTHEVLLARVTDLPARLCMLQQSHAVTLADAFDAQGTLVGTIEAGSQRLTWTPAPEASPPA